MFEQARVGLAHQGLRAKIAGLKLFLKFKLSLTRALSYNAATSGFGTKFCHPLKAIIF